MGNQNQIIRLSSSDLLTMMAMERLAEGISQLQRRRVLDF
jgi:hypothetical protein